MKSSGVYAVSADPITQGHIRIVERALGDYQQVVLAIGLNPDKNYLFTLEQRQEMAQRSLAHLPQVKVDSFQGLLVDYAYAHNLEYLIRGIRDKRDREAELVYTRSITDQNLGIKVDFIEAEEKYRHISSSLVKGVARANGLFGLRPNYVTPYVKQCLEAKLLSQYYVGITGAMGCGKSYVCKELVRLGQAQNVPISSVDLDSIGHLILQDSSLPMAIKARQEIKTYFGPTVFNPDGTVNRRKLGEIVFAEPRELNLLNSLLAKPIFVYLRDRVLPSRKGLILLESALFAESDIADWCNYNLILVEADSAVQHARIKARDDLTPEQLEHRLNSQFNTSRKKDLLQQQISANHHGRLWEFDNSGHGSLQIEQLLESLVKELDLYGALSTSRP